MHNIYFICNQKIWKYFEEYIDSIIHVLAQNEVSIQKILKDEISIRNWFRHEQLIAANPNKYVFIQSDYDIIYNPSIDVSVINTEQLTRNNYLAAMQRFLDKRYKVLDYSEENVFILKNSGNHANLINFIPYQVNPKEIYTNIPKTLNTCFIGCLSPRRSSLLQRIKNVNILKGWGEERDKQLFAHKIMINIHFNKDYGINEQIRINRCIFNRVIVVSEKSTHDNLLYLNKYIVFCDYDKIPDTVEDILGNYEYYSSKIFKDFDIDFIQKHLSSICKI